MKSSPWGRSAISRRHLGGGIGGNCSVFWDRHRSAGWTSAVSWEASQGGVGGGFLMAIVGVIKNAYEETVAYPPSRHGHTCQHGRASGTRNRACSLP
jgi:8-oxo-dGTP pyrophosphatase MutT (NUDIX family)